MVDDRDIRRHIGELVSEEKELRRKLGRGEISADDEHTRLRRIEMELDQYWDLLRQREARRGSGEDPDSAAVRPDDVVENYEG
jgi:predicted nuclease with TOPRIM domain